MNISKIFFLFSFSLCLGLFTGCQGNDAKEAQEPVLKKFERIPGEVQVLNGTSLTGMAATVREYLMGHGFDIVNVGNAHEQNFSETLIVYRNPDWVGKRRLEKSLQNPKTLILENPTKLVDVTIFVGRDIQERIHESRNP
jgi:hypothetical protein